MNISASQYSSSSGCESGWTMYLDQSSLSKNQCQDVDGNNYHNARFEDEEEDDLSMVSDASSGPPLYCQDEDFNCFDHQFATKKNKSKNKSKSSRNQHPYSYLDDTASSSVLNKNVGVNNEASTEFSQGFSATQIKGKKSSLKKHLGFFQSSLAEKSASKEPGGYQGRKWK